MMKKKHILFASFFIVMNLSAHSANVDTVALRHTQKQSLLEKIETWYDQNMNYATITALMTIESSFVPFPSEIVVPPAAYIASNKLLFGCFSWSSVDI